MNFENPVLMAIDQGTTSSRAILFSKDGDVLALRQKDLKIYTPQNGWVEQDANNIWQDTLWCVQSLIRDYPKDAIRIASIGITNQRETTILWNKKTGKPVYNAIVWQDRRTSDECQFLKSKGYEENISRKTGLLLDPYFSATKIKWILDHIDGARDLAEKGDLLFGTVDSYILWNLTGGKIHATDATNASRTMLYNIVENAWDDELIDMFDIPRSILPEVLDNISDFGETESNITGRRIPIGAMAGDQQAALFGQVCFDAGMVKATYGTGCFALMNIGTEFKQSKNRLLTTIAYRMNGQNTYAIEGAIFVAGAAVQWLRDDMHFFKQSSETESLAKSVPDTNGVYFVPAFTGLGAPYWRPDARGIITGITRGTTSAHIVRAALEAQAYQTRDLMLAFLADSGHDPKIIRADGGLVANGFVCQFLSDQLQKPIEIPRVIETTALGVAYMAGLKAGIYKNLSDVAEKWGCSRSYMPILSVESINHLYGGWQKAITQTLA